MSGDFFYQGIEREHTMAHANLDVLTAKAALEADDNLLKDIMQNSEEGKMMIIGGDFHQVLLVIEHGGRQDSVEACVNESALWSLFTIHHLDVNMRTGDAGNDWHERPLEIGNGDCIGADECVQVPEEMMCFSDIVTEIFVATLDSDRSPNCTSVPSFDRRMITYSV
uniref:ATP-dependent DNA helicase n=1 Tax=Haemonchus contortus TaxID=6289 RepID=A0A7I4YC91_HAECO